MDTSNNRRGLIIEHFEIGHSVRQIATFTNTPKSTVQDIIASFKKTGTTSSKIKGRPPTTQKLSTRDQRALARASTANPRAYARQIQYVVGGAATTVSVRTIERSLLKSGRIPYRPRKSPNSPTMG